ncbi:unnamed protein product [Sympodiomycopsis kandeliae]
MALPAPLKSGLLPSEVEYLATSSTDVQIVPLTSIDKARFLSGVYGPFRPPQRTTVPLWLALNLKKKSKCYIVPPEWMLIDNLKEILHTETTTLAFAEVPFHYVSISKVILDVAPDDVPQADEVRAMLKDLREARQSKISQGLQMLNPFHLEMSNISYSELCELRPFFGTAFSHLRAMRLTDADQVNNNGSGMPFDESLDSMQTYDATGRTESMTGHEEDGDEDDDGMGVASWKGR